MCQTFAVTEPLRRKVTDRREKAEVAFSNHINGQLLVLVKADELHHDYYPKLNANVHALITLTDHSTGTKFAHLLIFTVK